MRFVIVIFIAGFLVSSCIENEPSLTPRLMKTVNREFRKSRKKIQTEADSLCVIYGEENLPRIVDSLLEHRIVEDRERKIIIE